MSKPRSQRRRSGKYRPVYRLAPTKEPSRARDNWNGGNKENRGFERNPVSQRGVNPENLQTGTSDQGPCKSKRSKGEPFLLKSNEICYEERSVFGDLRLSNKLRGEALEKKNRRKKIQEKSKFGKQERENLCEAWKEEEKRAKFPGQSSQELPEILEDPLGQMKNVPVRSNFLSKWESTERTPKKFKEGSRIFSEPQNSFVSLGKTWDSPLNLFSQSRQVLYFEDRQNLSSKTEAPKTIPDRKKDSPGSDTNSENFFVKPIFDVLRECELPETLIHEELQEKRAFFEPNTPDILRKEKKFKYEEKEFGAQSPLFLKKKEKTHRISNKSNSQKSLKKPCFLDQVPRKKSRVSTRASEKIRPKPNKSTAKRTISLKEKFKQLNRLKKLNRLANASAKPIAKPFHPNSSKKITCLGSNHGASPQEFYFQRNLPFAQRRFFNGKLEPEPFKAKLPGFGYMRQAFKEKAKADFFRKDGRGGRGGTERGEDFSNKYKTEICKNFELTGKCQWSNMVG